MKDLPSLYARVCAVRPELAVAILEYEPDFASTHEDRGWSIGTSRNFRNAVSSEVAAALILARWVEALPVGFMLYQRTPNVWECDWINDIWYEDNPPKYIGPTPIEALAAFYLGEA